MPNYELYHAGIKGMKWGVRRFQNEDGSLTEAGKKRYAEVPKKETRVEKLEKRYRNDGMNEQEARQLAERRAKTEKILAVAGAITLTAAAAYVINKQMKYRVDGMLEAGTEMQRISRKESTDLNNPFYTSYKKSDNLKYRGFMGKFIDEETVNKLTLNASSKIKVASQKHAEDAFVDLYRKDKDFESKCHASIKEVLGMVNAPSGIKKDVDAFINDPSSVDDKTLRNSIYKMFNVSLINHSPNGNAAANSYYSSLKSKGYDALVDINDQKYSGYDTKKPLIVFSPEKVAVKMVESMSKDVVNEDYLKAKNLLVGETIAKAILTDVGMYGIGATGVVATVSATQTRAIEKYRKEHPNSKLTDKEILAMYN